MYQSTTPVQEGPETKLQIDGTEWAAEQMFKEQSQMCVEVQISPQLLSSVATLLTKSKNRQ